MFKTLVLGALYNLSDDRIEYQVRDRLSFMRFLGLGLGDQVPDARTVWLYREVLAQAGMVETLFKQFDGYLARQGYIARGGQIFDASIVPVPRNHNTRTENKAIKTDEIPDDWTDKPAKRSQKDVDARWTKKHGRSHYGYKNHVNVDCKHKLIRRYHVSDGAARFTSGGSPADAWQHRRRSLGGGRLPLRRDRGKIACAKAQELYPPPISTRRVSGCSRHSMIRLRLRMTLSAGKEMVTSIQGPFGIKVAQHVQQPECPTIHYPPAHVFLRDTEVIFGASGAANA